MNNLLTEQTDAPVWYGRRRYHVCCSFDTVLEVQRMYRDSRLTDWEKTVQALRMLVKDRFLVWLLTPVQKTELLNCVIKEHIDLPKRPRVGTPKRLFDFEEDSDYIYASFLQAYDLDLVECQGKLHWKKFIALFQGLPDGTKIREVMRIRGKEIPAPTRHNQKEIKELMELKVYYALGYHEDNGKEGLNRLFSTLEGIAL